MPDAAGARGWVTSCSTPEGRARYMKFLRGEQTRDKEGTWQSPEMQSRWDTKEGRNDLFQDWEADGEANWKKYEIYEQKRTLTHTADAEKNYELMTEADLVHHLRGNTKSARMIIDRIIEFKPADIVPNENNPNDPDIVQYKIMKQTLFKMKTEAVASETQISRTAKSSSAAGPPKALFNKGSSAFNSGVSVELAASLVQPSKAASPEFIAMLQDHKAKKVAAKAALPGPAKESGTTPLREQVAMLQAQLHSLQDAEWRGKSAAKPGTAAAAKKSGPPAKVATAPLQAPPAKLGGETGGGNGAEGAEAASSKTKGGKPKAAKKAKAAVKALPLTACDRARTLASQCLRDSQTFGGLILRLEMDEMSKGCTEILIEEKKFMEDQCPEMRL